MRVVERSGFRDDRPTRREGSRPCVLLVAAGPAAASLRAGIERHAALDAICVDDGVEAVELLDALRPEVAFIGEGVGSDERIAICRRLHDAPRLCGVPLLVAVEPSAEQVIESAYAAGATDVVYLPVHGAVLARRLARLADAGRTRAELERKGQELEQARRAVGFASWSWNLSTGAIDWSAELGAVLGLPVDGEPRPPALEQLLDALPADDARRLSTELERTCRDRGSYGLEHRLRQPDGASRRLRHEGRVIVNGRGEEVLHAILHDRTDERSSDERIHRLAYYDALTELPNVVMFNELLAHALSRVERGAGALAVMLVDLNGFKHVTGRFGREGGEAVLTEIAARLVRYVRRSDYVARQAMNAAVARQGGDRFAMMLSDVREVDDVARVARRVLGGVAEPILCRGAEIVTTASMGISVAPDDGTDVDTLIRNAETALHCAKRNGRNSFHFYSTSMNHELVERFEVETNLRRALERDELRLYYQPLMDVRTGRRTGLEALVRWQHPELGLILPGEFIPVAEDSELIHPLGAWVLRTASRQIVSWGVPWRLAVNISATQLSEPGFVEGVINVLAETGLPPGQLELELTESGVLRNHSATRHKLARLKQLGVRLAVDDFGTGYSALSYLRDFPLDTVKIDRSFVGSLESAERNGTLIAAMISMAHHLGLRVTGEGVETEAQLRFLTDHRCDEAQGFLIGRPEDAAFYDFPELAGDEPRAGD